jgi:hypothetical protein
MYISDEICPRYRIRGADYENTYGLVVFLDALGIKESWKTKHPEKV